MSPAVVRRLAAIGAALGVLLAACASDAIAPDLPPVTPGVDVPAGAPATVGPPPPSTPTAIAPRPIAVDAVGDISLAREVADRMAFAGPDYPYALVAPLLRGDVGIANLEGALTERGEPWPKTYNFRTPPRFAPGLATAGFDVVSLANNHTLDYGATGLLDTIAALDAAGVHQAGAGANATLARAPAVVETAAGRLAVLAYAATPDEGGGFSVRQWIADGDSPGLAYGTPDAIASDVRAAKLAADFVIVMVHAGDEYVNAPNATQRALVEAALDAGADAYIGHHAHVVQPVELRGNQLVAWGLGNFIFDLDSVDLANIPEPRVSLILRFTLAKGTGVTSYDIVALTQDAAEDRPRPATPDEAEVLRKLVGGNLAGAAE